MTVLTRGIEELDPQNVCVRSFPKLIIRQVEQGEKNLCRKYTAWWLKGDFSLIPVYLLLSPF